MFTKRSTADVNKSKLKIQDSKKDSASRLRHIKSVLDQVNIEDAKSLFETNFSHVYFILNETFVQAESNLRQRVHKAHREELDGALWLLGKLLCLLPELVAKRWQCHALSRLLAKLLHHGNNAKLRREGVRYFLLWYSVIGENAPAHVHTMFQDLVPGLAIPQTGSGITVTDSEFNAINDLMSHPNMKGDIGGAVFHDTADHPVRAPEIAPLIPPGFNERSAAPQPDPQEGIDVLLECMVHITGCIKWREDSLQKHLKSFAFLLKRFREVYLPVICPQFDQCYSIYEPRLELPVMRVVNKREEKMGGCVVKLINWIVKYTRDRQFSSNLGFFHAGEDDDFTSLLANLRHMGYSQPHIVQDVLLSTRENVNFVCETYRQAFLLGFSSKEEINATKSVTQVIREWINVEHRSYPPFFLELPVQSDAANATGASHLLKDTSPPRLQRIRTDSYLGAMTTDNIFIPAGTQNVLQALVTNAANVFMVQTEYLVMPKSEYSSRYREITPLDEQTEICKCVLNIYRTMVMTARMDAKTWEQLLLVLLQITAVILNEVTPSNSKRNLGGRLGQPVFQTLIVTWIRAHTHVPVPNHLWEKFLNVLSSLTHREELISEWHKTMQTLTRVMARHVYHINLLELPLDRLAETKIKRRRGVAASSYNPTHAIDKSASRSSQWESDSAGGQKRPGIGDHPERTRLQPDYGNAFSDQHECESRPNMASRSGIASGSSTLNRSYSEGSLAPFRKSRQRNRTKGVPSKGPSSLAHLDISGHPLKNITNISISTETLNQPTKGIGERSSSYGQIRRTVSLDSIKKMSVETYNSNNKSESMHGSRSPSPTASSGIESASIKDSPIQIDTLAVDSNSLDTQDDHDEHAGVVSQSSILMGGTTRGWLPDVAALMWKRMLGSLGDVNQITNPKLHAAVFRHLINITISLIKILLNQGVLCDTQTSLATQQYVPPIGIMVPWCYVALALPSKYGEGKLCAMRLLCTIIRHRPPISIEEIPLFYHAIHQALVGEDRKMAYVAVRYLGGPRFLSLLLPGHSLLLLDLVHACTIILTTFESPSSASNSDSDVDGNLNQSTPRAYAAGLLCSLLCCPKTSLPNPVLKPTPLHVETLDCLDLQEHILSVVLRCARREPSSKARCIAIAALGQWVLQCFMQQVPMQYQKASPAQIRHTTDKSIPLHTTPSPRIKEAIAVILQAMHFKHSTIARVAAESIKLFAGCGKQLAKLEQLPHLIVNALCTALQIHNVSNPKEVDKVVVTSLLLCLGEICMTIPLRLLTESHASRETGDSYSLVGNVLQTLHQIITGNNSHKKTIVFTADKDFDMHISLDDVHTQRSSEASYQTTETTQNCLTAIRLCAKTVAMHLVTNIGHFPMGIGATRLSSTVDEQDDMLGGQAPTSNDQMLNSLDNATSQIINGINMQMFLLNPGLVSSFIELPTLRLPGGGSTAGLVTASRQVRVLLRDLNGKACWDVSVLYMEPVHETRENLVKETATYSPAKMVPHLNSLGHHLFPTIPSALDPMPSTVAMPLNPLRHTMRRRQPHQLPVAADIASDLDQLDDILQYIGHTSPECLDENGALLNAPSTSPLGAQMEGHVITTILNQRALEHDFLKRQQTNTHSANHSYSSVTSSKSHMDTPFSFGRLLFSQLGMAGWERRKQTHLLVRTDKLLRELRNLDSQRCRETHKMAVIYVASGQEEKTSILRNSCGSSVYEMFVSALGWEIELESHNGFLGGLSRQGCGSTCPYFATPYLEVVYHVATRMPSDTPEAILNKTRHLGNDEVHIVWSEHHRDYRRDILPTEFCDILIVVYPLRNGLFRVTVNRKAEVPWFGPLFDESIVGGSCLAALVRATAINASRAKRTSLPFYQQFYEERKRSLDSVALRHKDSNTYEEFAARIYNPISSMHTQNSLPGGNIAPLASALLDHQRSSGKNWIHHLESINHREGQHGATAAGGGSTSAALDASPRSYRKIHPFKNTSKPIKQSMNNTPPDSPTFPSHRFK